MYYTYINIYIYICEYFWSEKMEKKHTIKKSNPLQKLWDQGTCLGISIEVRADDELVAFEVQQNVEVPVVWLGKSGRNVCFTVFLSWCKKRKISCNGRLITVTVIHIAW